MTLTAKPDPGSALDVWSNGVCDEQGSALTYSGLTCTTTLTTDKTVSVSFAQSTLLVFFSGDGKGQVTSSPPGISCSANCKANFAKRTTVTLTAKPAAGSAIVGWSNGVCKEQGSKLTYAGPVCTIW